MPEPQVIALSFRVTGRVQGVWFRAWTRRQAGVLGLTGWVRNEPDGAVSGVIQGPGAAVRRMVELLHEGPEPARVEDVRTEPCPVEAPPAFEIRR